VSATEEETLQKYKNQLLKVLKHLPTSVDTVYVAFDGVAPLAKRKTQRKSRFDTTRRIVHGVSRDIRIKNKLVRVPNWFAQENKDRVLKTNTTEEESDEEEPPKEDNKHEKEKDEEEIKEEQKEVPLKKRKVMSKEENEEDDEMEEGNDENKEENDENGERLVEDLNEEQKEIKQKVPKRVTELLKDPNVFISDGILKRLEKLDEKSILKSQKSIELSPSTDLMHRLYEFTVLYFSKACICKKVVISPSTVEGEGETKVMKYFRNHCVKKNGKYMIVSSDSDMILSALILLHEFSSMKMEIKINTMQRGNFVFCNTLYKFVYHIPTFVISILLKSGCDYFSPVMSLWRASHSTDNIFYEKSKAFEIEEKEDGKIILTINQSSLDMLFDYRKNKRNVDSLDAQQKENVEKFLKQVVAVYYQFGGKITIMKTFDFKKGELFSYLNNFTDNQIIIETSRKEIEEQFKITPLESLYSLISCHNGHALPSPEHAKVFKHNEFLTKLFDHSNLKEGTELFKSEETYIELRKAFQEIGIVDNSSRHLDTEIILNTENKRNEITIIEEGVTKSLREFEEKFDPKLWKDDSVPFKPKVRDRRGNTKRGGNYKCIASNERSGISQFLEKHGTKRNR
ncbi:hypothetical protein ABK040_016003, partial [Willaertia magna]